MGNVVKKLGDAIFYGGDPAVQEEAKKAQQEQLAIQNKTLTRQEAVVNQQQTELAQKAQAALKARRGGGLRSLLSGSELGLTDQSSSTKLGGG
jgi:chaperonin cofactor prefoldin